MPSSSPTPWFQPQAIGQSNRHRKNNSECGPRVHEPVWHSAASRKKINNKCGAQPPSAVLLLHRPGAPVLHDYIRRTFSGDTIASRLSCLADTYFPIQELLKIRFRMSSVVVSPVMASSGGSAP